MLALSQHSIMARHITPSYGGNIGERGIEQIEALIDALAQSIMARLLPDPTGSTTGFVPKVNAAKDGFELAADERGGAGGGSLTIRSTRTTKRYCNPTRRGCAEYERVDLRWRQNGMGNI